MKLVVTPPALAELHDAAAFYMLKTNVELGLALVAEFERTANLTSLLRDGEVPFIR